MQATTATSLISYELLNSIFIIAISYCGLAILQNIRLYQKASLLHYVRYPFLLQTNVLAYLESVSVIDTAMEWKLCNY